jgi:hypothetical protein
MARYGFSWLTQPLVLALIALTVLVVAYPFVQERRRGSAGRVHAD